MQLCDFGCNRPAIKQFKSGKFCCSNSTSSCPVMKEKNSQTLKELRDKKGNSYWKNGHPKGSSKGTSLKGKSWEEIFGDRADIERLKRAESLKGNKNWDNLSDDQKNWHAEKARQNILKRYESGWLPKAGRCKKYLYESPIAGKVYLDGTWELTVAKWLDHKQFNWKRNTKRFPYTNLKGKVSYYTPDFWIEELKGYLEVKGYETDLDRCKWKQFPEMLTIWKKEEIKNLEWSHNGIGADC